MKSIFHITKRSCQETAAKMGWYEPSDYAREGFIHCSYLEQVIAVSNRLFQGQTDLVLLEVDPMRLDCEVVTENLEGGSELFPHIYGRLPWAAVLRIHDLCASANGLFQLPGSISRKRGSI